MVRRPDRQAGAARTGPPQPLLAATPERTLLVTGDAGPPAPRLEAL